MLYLGKSGQPGFHINDIIAFCRARKIAVHAEEDKNELYQWQQLHSPDIVFFSGYSYKVNVVQLKGVPKGIYNIHFGVLPQYRGASPVFWQLKNGEAQMGLTIHEMTDRLDSGAVVWEQTIKNEEYHTYNYINQLFSELQVRGVAELLIKLSQEQLLHKSEQDESRGNYYGKPQLADVMINWDTMDVKEILNLVKACTSWNNGAGTLINGLELKILDAETALAETNNKPGTITIANNKFNVACINNKALSINFLNINNTCIPARHAGFYGLKTGQIFISKIYGIAGKI
ncbi:methionyl-tRNA formyltransferase [Mucilaginibacter pineti]|uniref:Methionyl-tRNA formyltransferase n=2 Tax=Mucilaginibacter pineti TaxID=1391627 RepID=A0A1G7DIV7_9SPHI|nr:methionyl-tRNA formyltransferase [Mucilaginibacter pineti]